MEHFAGLGEEPAALLSDAGLEPHRPNHPDLETEVAQSSSSRTCPTWRRWSNRCASPGALNKPLGWRLVFAP